MAIDFTLTKEQQEIQAMARSFAQEVLAPLAPKIDAEPDPLVIDLSGVERMDTVGAWLVYRAVRDRGAKVVGASPTLTTSGL